MTNKECRDLQLACRDVLLALGIRYPELETAELRLQTLAVLIQKQTINAVKEALCQSKDSNTTPPVSGSQSLVSSRSLAVHGDTSTPLDAD